MKAVRQLETPTSGLVRFLETHSGEASWEVFRNFNGSAAYRELIAALATAQRGLCAYCEIRLMATDRQVEHFLPKEKHPSLTFDVGNLFATCCGGTKPHNPKGPDPSREALKPSKRSCSCGQFKGEKVLDGSNPRGPSILKPSEIPPVPRLFEVKQGGSISADAQGCKAVGIAIELAQATVVELNLDCERLRVVRKKVWDKLGDDVLDAMGDGADDDAYATAMEYCARVYLLPDPDGHLDQFFTTQRCFFGEFGDRLLSEDDSDWM